MNCLQTVFLAQYLPSHPGHQAVPSIHPDHCVPARQWALLKCFHIVISVRSKSHIFAILMSAGQIDPVTAEVEQSSVLHPDQVSWFHYPRSVTTSACREERKDAEQLPSILVILIIQILLPI